MVEFMMDIDLLFGIFAMNLENINEMYTNLIATTWLFYVFLAILT